MPFAHTVAKYQQSYKQVPWTHNEDGNLKWGDQIMLQNDDTKGWVVMDIGDKVPNVEEGYSLTSTASTANPGPMTRSVFTLSPVEQGSSFGGDQYIRYGQKVRIHANEYLYRK